MQIWRGVGKMGHTMQNYRACRWRWWSRCIRFDRSIMYCTLSRLIVDRERRLSRYKQSMHYSPPQICTWLVDVVIMLFARRKIVRLHTDLHSIYIFLLLPKLSIASKKKWVSQVLVRLSRLKWRCMDVVQGMCNCASSGLCIKEQRIRFIVVFKVRSAILVMLFDMSAVFCKILKQPDASLYYSNCNTTGDSAI